MREVIAALVLVLVNTTVLGQVTFTRIADTNTIAPETLDPFLILEAYPTISNGIVAIAGASDFVGRGIYTYPATGGVGTRIVDGTIFPPGKNSAYDYTVWPAIKNGNVAFFGAWVSFVDEGYVAYPLSGGGSGAVLASTLTKPPGSNYTFTGFYHPTSNGTRLVFAARSGDAFSDPNGNHDRERGMYSYPLAGGQGVLIAGQSTPIPGGSGNFNNFRAFNTGVDGNLVAFRGDGPLPIQQQGIYVYPILGGDGTRVADLTTSIPGGPGIFTAFDNWLDMANGRVIFTAQGGVQRGIYNFPATGGPGLRVLDSNQFIPGSSSKFDIFRSVTTDGDGIVFRARGTEGEDFLAYVNMDGSGYQHIVGLGDLLDGRIVSGFGFGSASTGTVGPGSFDDHQVVFQVEFSNGDEGIYVATIAAVPEPAVFAFFSGMGVGGAIAWYRRRKRMRQSLEADVGK